MDRLILAGFLLLFAGAIRADNGWDGQVFSLYWENDAIAGEDRHYTQGAGISYLSKDDALPGWLNWLSDKLPDWGMDTDAEKYGVGVAQEIYTPEDLQASELIEDDQPYAGWLFGRFLLQHRGRGMGWLETMGTYRLDLGVIGPESQAEDTQKTWHGSDPKGWPHQLKTEPGIVLGYDRRWLIRFRGETSPWALDVIPYLGLEGGNVSTLAKMGLGTRVGYRVPNEFEVAPMDPGYHYGFYFFAGLEGRYVYRNIFLDGNTFQSSHSIDKRSWVGSYNVGLTLVLKRFEIRVYQTFHTPEFGIQNTSDSVGRAALSYKF